MDQNSKNVCDLAFSGAKLSVTCQNSEMEQNSNILNVVLFHTI